MKSKVAKAVVQIVALGLVAGGALAGCKRSEVGVGGAGAHQGSYAGQGARTGGAAYAPQFHGTGTSAQRMAGGEHSADYHELISAGSSTNVVAVPDVWRTRTFVGLSGQHWPGGNLDERESVQGRSIEGPGSLVPPQQEGPGAVFPDPILEQGTPSKPGELDKNVPVTE